MYTSTKMERTVTDIEDGERSPAATNFEFACKLAICTDLKVSEGALRAAVRLRQGLASGSQVVAFTGVEETDAAASLAAQISLALVQIEQTRVLLVDANVLRPKIHEWMQVPVSPGLCDLVGDSLDIHKAIHPSDVDRLFVLSVGNSAANLVSLFSSLQCEKVFRSLRQQFRYIIVNLPPVLLSPEGLVLASVTDGVVISLAAGRRRRDEVLRMKRELTALKTPILGAILAEEI